MSVFLPIFFSFFFTERELVLELERLRTKNGKNKRDKSPSKLDSYVKTLEEERDYFKGEVEVLNKIMKNKALASTSTPSSPSRSRTSSPSRSSTKTKVRCRMEPLSEMPIFRIYSEFRIFGHKKKKFRISKKKKKKIFFFFFWITFVESCIKWQKN